jgi:hypothetical protein
MTPKYLTAGLAIALAVTLAIPTLAGAATANYRGPIADSGGGKIRVETTIRRGKVKKVRAFELFAQGLPAQCDVSGATALTGTLDGPDLRVGPDRRFSLNVSNGEGDAVFFNGRFSSNYRRVRGRLELSIHFEQPQDQICASDRHRYSAAR